MPSIKKDDGNIPVRTEARMTVNRSVYSLPSFEAAYKTLNRQSRSLSVYGKRAVKECTWSRVRETIGDYVPVTRWLPQYKVKQFLLSDIIVGITIAIFQVPQSMGYCLIAHVPPIYGLYTSFFPALVYFFLGTSKHSAFGAFAIVSGVMTGNVVAELLADKGYSLSDIENGKVQSELTPIEIASALSFTMGCYAILFGILRLGFISIYLSEQLISGFATAASFYVFTSQLRYLFGAHLPYNSGILAVVRNYVDLVTMYKDINLITTGISLLCVIILLFFKIYVNEKLKKNGINIPFPIELLVVIGGTAASHFIGLHEKYGVQVVGQLQNGLPAFRLPSMSTLNLVYLQAIPVAAVGYIISLTIAKIYGEKHGYEINANQELLAIGFANAISSCFSCIPCSASLPRSALQDTGGGKTQVVSLVNCSVMLLVLFFLASLLSELPNCVLAACIAVALKSLLEKVMDFRRYWNVSKLDGAMWMLGFWGVIILDVDIGLCVGVLFSLLVLIYKTSRPKTYILGSVGGVDIYVPLKKYTNACEIEGIRIYQFCGPLHFANRDYFKLELIKRTRNFVNTQFPVTQSNSNIVNNSDYNENGNNNNSNNNSTANLNTNDRSALDPNFITVIQSNSSIPDPVISPLHRYLILDFSMVSYMDAAGITTLRKCIQEFQNKGIFVYMAACVPHVVQAMERDKFFVDFSKHNLYVTVHDAVACAVAQRKARLNVYADLGDSDNDNSIPRSIVDNRFY